MAAALPAGTVYLPKRNGKVDVPQHWSASTADIALVQLPPESQEFAKVQRLLHKTNTCDDHHQRGTWTGNGPRSLRTEVARLVLPEGADRCVSQWFPKVTVLEVIRVENKRLWESYVRHKAEKAAAGHGPKSEEDSIYGLLPEQDETPLVEDPRDAMDESMNECFLWHGCRPETLRAFHACPLAHY